jgi:hypothetical protein
MRLAKLKVKIQHEKETDHFEIYASPSEILLTDYGIFTSVDTRHDRHRYSLDMPLDEAVFEINAAMNYGSGVPDGYDIMYVRKADTVIK